MEGACSQAKGRFPPELIASKGSRSRLARGIGSNRQSDPAGKACDRQIGTSKRHAHARRQRAGTPTRTPGATPARRSPSRRAGQRQTRGALQPPSVRPPRPREIDADESLPNVKTESWEVDAPR